jgi:hypothetical protein
MHTEPKRASFKDKVDVYYYTAKDIGTTHFPDDDVFENKTECSRCSSISDELEQMEKERNDITFDNQQVPELVKCIDSDIASYTDYHGNRYKRLHMKMFVDDCCVKSKTSVKALSGGNSVIVQLYLRDMQHADMKQTIPGMCLEAKMPLPLQIDPYSVKVRVHEDGILTLSACMPFTN